MPIWGIHGGADLISIHEIVRAEVDEWEQLCDVQIRWTTYPDVGHYETFETAYRDPDVFRWLGTHRTGH